MNVLKREYHSIKNALAGIHAALGELHFLYHLAATSWAVILGLVFNISAGEWAAIILCIALVISLELVNTALERLCDFVNPDQNQKIRDIKDMAAAAVLIGSIAAFVVGLIIFLPKMI